MCVCKTRKGRPTLRRKTIQGGWKARGLQAPGGVEMEACPLQHPGKGKPVLREDRLFSLHTCGRRRLLAMMTGPPAYLGSFLA